MQYLFVEYPKCSTCQKAKKWLSAKGVAFEDRHIVENTPTAAELKEWIGRSGKPISKFFNTSGMVYRDMGLKDKLPSLSQEEQLELLSGNGMLIKRPLLIWDGGVLVGFREKEWEEAVR